MLCEATGISPFWAKSVTMTSKKCNTWHETTLSNHSFIVLFYLERNIMFNELHHLPSIIWGGWVGSDGWTNFDKISFVVVPLLVLFFQFCSAYPPPLPWQFLIFHMLHNILKRFKNCLTSKKGKKFSLLHKLTFWSEKACGKSCCNQLVDITLNCKIWEWFFYRVTRNKITNVGILPNFIKIGPHILQNNPIPFAAVLLITFNLIDGKWSSLFLSVFYSFTNSVIK